MWTALSTEKISVNWVKLVNACLLTMPLNLKCASFPFTHCNSTLMAATLWPCLFYIMPICWAWFLILSTLWSLIAPRYTATCSPFASAGLDWISKLQVNDALSFVVRFFSTCAPTFRLDWDFIKKAFIAHLITLELTHDAVTVWWEATFFFNTLTKCRCCGTKYR